MKFPAQEIADILHKYILDAEKRYARLNDCEGAVMCATFEFIRRNPYRMPPEVLKRILSLAIDFCAEWYAIYCIPYEDLAIKKNGDVYPKEEK